MKDLSKITRSTSIHGLTGRRLATDRVGKMPRCAGLSRWRALENGQFRALVAAPQHQNRFKGGARSC
jgi:hypothetical protein